MSSVFKAGQYLRWCTQLPDMNCARESPVFILNGNEWFFRFGFTISGFFEIRVELKQKHKDWEIYDARYMIGFKDNEMIAKGRCNISDHNLIWHVYMHQLKASLPNDFFINNWIEFVVWLDDVNEPILKFDNESEHISPDLRISSQNFCQERALQDFSQMLQDGLDHDIKLKCDGQTWKVHKSILSSRSSVLKAMLHNDMIEGRTGVITLHDMDKDCAQKFLNYLYSGELPEMTMSNAKIFYEIGDKFAVDCLKKACANYLARILMPENACEILTFAIDHNDSSFKESVVNFIVSKKTFMKDDDWRDFRGQHPEIAFEIYDRFFKTRSSV